MSICDCVCIYVCMYVLFPQKLNAFKQELDRHQHGKDPWDDARYTLLRCCIMRLTFFAVDTVHAALKAQDNHTYVPVDNDANHYVLHRCRRDWMFSVVRTVVLKFITR